MPPHPLSSVNPNLQSFKVGAEQREVWRNMAPDDDRLVIPTDGSADKALKGAEGRRLTNRRTGGPPRLSRSPSELGEGSSYKMTNSQPPPNEIYAVFSGDINAANVQKIFQGITGAMASGVIHLHLLFQTWGGYIGDGVCLYNFFRALPFGLTLYNVGTVQSIGVIAYLGSKERKASTYASFMIHRSQASPQSANADRLKLAADSLLLDDQRTEAILREHITLADDQWTVHKYGDLYLTGAQAVAAGIATSIGEFSPPGGTKIFQI